MATVRDLMRGRLGAAGRLVAGASGADAAVSWVVSARARTPALDPLQGGEVVLLPPPALAHLGGDAALAGLIPGLRDAGAAAVCVWAASASAARASADAAGAPLVEVRDASPADLERALLDEITGQLRRGLRQQQDRQSRLLDTLAANRGLDGLVRVLADHLGTRAAYLPADGGAPVLSDGTRPPVPPDLGRRLPDRPEVVALGEGEGAVWATPVLHRGARIGALVAGGVSGAPGASATLALRQTAAAISVEQGRLDAAAQAGRRLRDDLYRDLFAGSAPDALYGRARSLGVTLPPEGIVAIVATREPDARLPEPAKDRVHALLGRQAAYPVLDDGRRLLAYAPETLRGDATVGLLVRALGAAADSVALGVSDPVGDVVAVPAGVAQAETALLVSRRIRGGAPTRFGEAGVYRLLAPLRDSAAARQAADRLLRPLVEYDTRHNATLVETLEAYIAANGNASLTAQALNLHRNSLAYRLRRIEELTRVSLADPESRLLLALVLQLRRLG